VAPDPAASPIEYTNSMESQNCKVIISFPNQVANVILLTDSVEGLVQFESAHPFGDTLQRLESIITPKGLTVFARIDFSGDAEKAGLKMDLTRLIIFGNPKAGTPLMVARPSIAIDFPLKILVSQDGNGKTWVTYNSPDYLKNRHHIPDDLLKNIYGIVAIVESVAH
jgi:uncharacterized protein (DUF302 family)